MGIFSYDGNVQFGITGDYDSAADIGVLREGIQRGIAELVAIAEAPAKEAPATTVKGEPAARSSPAQKRRRNRAATTRHDPETSMSTSHIAQTTAEHALDRICALAALGEQTVEILSDAPKEC